MKPSASETIAELQTPHSVASIHSQNSDTEFNYTTNWNIYRYPNMDLYMTIAKCTLKLAISVSVETIFEKFVSPMTTTHQFDPTLIVVAKTALKTSVEVLVERSFETIMRRVQHGTQSRMEGEIGGEGVDEEDGIV